MKEVWKDIEGYEGYQVSSEGKIRSFRSPTGWGIVEKSHFIKEKIDRYGYSKIVLMKNKKPTYHTIHRIVAETFIENKENKPTVNHKNGIKTDNRVENLEWMTILENNTHAYKTGLTKKTPLNNPKSKKVEQIDLNGCVVKAFPSTKEVQRNLGFCASCIAKAAKSNGKSHGYRWRYV